jgi:hypothetical protein
LSEADESISAFSNSDIRPLSMTITMIAGAFQRYRNSAYRRAMSPKFVPTELLQRKSFWLFSERVLKAASS